LYSVLLFNYCNEISIFTEQQKAPTIKITWCTDEHHVRFTRVVSKCVQWLE